MLFIVRIGALIPSSGPSENSMGKVIGIVNKFSLHEVADVLEVTQWDGWENIPGVQAENWRKWGKNLFFTPFETEEIDRNPKNYGGTTCRMRFITITGTIELKKKIPDKVWKLF